MKKLFILLSLLSLVQLKLIKIEAYLDDSNNNLIFNNERYYKVDPIKTSLNNFEIIEIPSNEMNINNEISSFEYWVNLIIFILLSCFAGTMSGLTVGYLSIDSLILEIKISNGSESEKYYAGQILRIISNHHWILVTLLLCNAFACEAMPLVLHKLVSEAMAIVISVGVLLLVGEIIPQALCTGPNQMKIASFLAPFAYFLMIVTSPLSYPIAKFMDLVIGIHEQNRFSNTDLKSVLELHTKEALEETLSQRKDFGLTKEQVKLIKNIFEKKNKNIKELMIPIEKVKVLSYDSIMNKSTIIEILQSGYSRIPIYKNKKTNLIGILRIKNLIGIDLNNELETNKLNIKLTQPIIASPETEIDKLFDQFIKGKSHMAFIVNNLKRLKSYNNFSYNNIINSNNECIGIITLEDLLEYILNISILDEEDYKLDIHKENQLKENLASKFTKDFINYNKDKLNELYDKSKSKSREININKEKYI